MRTCVCPNCGTDLTRFEPTERGDLSLAAHEIKWKGQRVPLSPSERLMVSAIARANGLPVRRMALAEAVGADETRNPENSVSVYAHRIKAAFRQIDPTFDCIKSTRGTGLSWEMA